jgi:tRNA(Arg) A34 adenosine deaminase TadA
VLAVNLEPCLMCLGAAMTLGVREVLFGLESPGYGAAEPAARRATHPDAPWSVAPAGPAPWPTCRERGSADPRRTRRGRRRPGTFYERLGFARAAIVFEKRLR